MNKNILLSSLLITSLNLLPVSHVSAEGMSVEDMFTKCGIGAAVFPDRKTFAAISNVTWDSGTTAVSSGLSNSGCDNNKTDSAALIYKKYAAIESETASGSGQHLTALMDINQCNTQSQKVVLNGIRDDFSTMLKSNASYSTQSQLSKSKTYFKILDKNITSSCII